MSPHDLGADKTNYAQSLMHMIKGNLGTGILAMPISFKHCGLLTASIGLPVLCLIATFCVHLLVRSSQHLESKMKWENLDYAALAKGSFKAGPKWLRSYSGFMNRVVDAVLIISQIGICCVYLVFIVDNIETILRSLSSTGYRNETMPNNGINNDYRSTSPITHERMIIQSDNSTDSHTMLKHNNDQTVSATGPQLITKSYIFIGLIPFVVLICWIRTLRRLSILSACANCLQALGISLIVYNLITTMPSEPNVEMTAPLEEVALGFGSAMFAFEGISVVLPIYTRMKKPEQMGSTWGIVNVSYVLLLFLYCGVGVLGYLRFGSEVKDSITLNLPPSPINQTIRAAFAASIFLTYPLQFYVPHEIIWTWVKNRVYTDAHSDPKKVHKLDYAFRALLVVITFALAISVPMLNLLMDLVGSISGTALSITLPAIIHLATFWEDISGKPRIVMITIDPIMSEYDDLLVNKSKLKFKDEKRKKHKSSTDESRSDRETEAAGSSTSVETSERLEDSEIHGGWWRVTKHEHIDEDVAIEFQPGCYIKAMSNGSITLGEPHPPGDGPDDEEIFTAIPAPSNQFALKSGFGRYLSVDPKTKKISGLSEAYGEQELFLASFEGNNAAICCFTDTFLRPIGEPGQQSIVAQSRTVGPEEMLTIRVNYDPLMSSMTKQPEEGKKTKLGSLYESELGHLKKLQAKGLDLTTLESEKKHLKKARLDGHLHEALLDKREKHKSDKYCK